MEEVMKRRAGRETPQPAEASGATEGSSASPDCVRVECSFAFNVGEIEILPKIK